MSHTKLIRRLVEAAREGRSQAVVALLDYGLDVNSCDHNGNTALIAAAHEGRADVITILNGRGAAVDGPNRDGATPLMWAVQANRTHAARLLLKLGASVAAVDSEGLTPLMYGANTLANGSVRLLIRHGAAVNARTGDGSTALIYAVFAGCETYQAASKNPTVQALLSAGADPFLAGADGCSALDIAREHSAHDYVVLLTRLRAPDSTRRGGA